MTILVSVNLNKRFNSQETRGKLAHWLSCHHADVVLVQEPWKAAPITSAHFADFMPIGGNGRVFLWLHARYRALKIDMVEEFCQRIELNYVIVYNVYLDAYDRRQRAWQLSRIQHNVIAEGNRPVLILGDFNIAPEPSDGLINGKVSTFNSEIDRGSLRQLLETCSLVDLGRGTELSQWTIERELRDQKVQFRCDLALVSDYISPAIDLRLDSTTRATPHAFTDHSGLVLNIPVTITEAEHQLMLFPLEPIGSTPAGKVEIRPEKTAMHRVGPSSVARRLGSLIREASVKSILDYGCGYGEDVKYYRTLGVRAEGYDPHPPFGWIQRPTGTFDLVTVIFVLNVLPDPWERLKVLYEAAKHVPLHGLMIVASRSPDEIRHEAETKNWKSFNDGYWSHEGKKTFQHGLSREELFSIAKRVGFTESPLSRLYESSQGTACVVLQRREPIHSRSEE